ncbi:MAG: hypothetical protein HGA49_03500 [Eubacteriaceae bacterium]|nr:hypothetical protein [Eubacteriaceae bacterium]
MIIINVEKIENVKWLGSIDPHATHICQITEDDAVESYVLMNINGEICSFFDLHLDSKYPDDLDGLLKTTANYLVPRNVKFMEYRVEDRDMVSYFKTMFTVPAGTGSRRILIEDFIDSVKCKGE